MKIEITEETGIKDAKYGHMQPGEVRVVDDDFGRFVCANGWARDLEGLEPTGERGKLDRKDPAEWAKENPPEPRVEEG